MDKVKQLRRKITTETNNLETFTRWMHEQASRALIRPQQIQADLAEAAALRTTARPPSGAGDGPRPPAEYITPRDVRTQRQTTIVPRLPLAGVRAVVGAGGSSRSARSRLPIREAHLRSPHSQAASDSESDDGRAGAAGGRSGTPPRNSGRMDDLVPADRPRSPRSRSPDRARESRRCPDGSRDMRFSQNFGKDNYSRD